MKRVRFLIGFPLMIAFIIIGYIFVSFEYPTTCIYTTEWINKIGVWEKHNSYDDYETLFWNGVIQRDSDSIKLYYIVPFNSNGELLDTIKFNSTQIKGTTDCN
ncbi:MAG: hypothetical protein COB73_00710 [Flavobacteriaceae bacterium]|nr:MAG: hypothetical protein COB73_00710 [Flavobacteriaceae bacterium]